ncbi:hypothetical protein B0T11DRAFT_320647 [Plectosphaerella cucumerina]|uniref:Fungal N-terminal domain-containing protein n=1 Tax=Plectosphaerella cucumerina TaxID=40658 RepID=A0A8K0T7Y8_9PEZI|nr:hypothetical protein B0T11DRAFT_320647 [Plectosphaerella cucumerina]
MEPLAALRLASNIITLIDFCFKLINAASSARHSASASAADKALAELTANCRTTCDQLNELVKRIKGKGSGSRKEGLRVAAKGLWHKDKLQELEKRLECHRSQIMDHFNRIFPEEQSVKLRTLADSQAGMTGKVAEEMEKQLKETQGQISRMMESVHASSASVTNKLLRDICDRLSEMSTRTKTMNAEQDVLNLLWFPELRTWKNAVEEAHKGTYRWLLHDPKTDAQQTKSSHHTSNIIAKMSHSYIRKTKDKDVWRGRFITWLQAQEGQGSFFISGKDLRSSAS